MDRPTSFLARDLALLGKVLAFVAVTVFFLVVAAGWRPEGLVFELLRYEMGISRHALEILATMGVLLFLGWGLYLLICVGRFARVADRELPARWLCPTVTFYLAMIWGAMVPRILSLHDSCSEALLTVLALVPTGAFALSVALGWRVFYLRRKALEGREPSPSRMVGAEGFEPPTNRV